MLLIIEKPQLLNNLKIHKMKKPLFLLLSFLCFISCKEQSERQEQDNLKQSNEKKQTNIDLPEKQEDAELIASWYASDPDSNALGKVNSEDEVSITVHQNHINISKTHKNKTTRLVSVYDEYLPNSHTYVKVYAYDFDKDGQKEIVVFYSFETAVSVVEVFRYREDFTELVGKFNAQDVIYFEDNSLILPYGGQGLYSEYLYKDEVFYELKYHSPQQE